MNDFSLAEYLRDYLSGCLDSYEVNVDALGDDIADSLERHGYCSDPYLDYDKALMCPINKKREKYCNNALCSSHNFCKMLRKEGYI